MKFEEKLISLRKKQGLSQEELAEKLNVTRQTISKWELGQSKPDMEKLVEISKLYNIGVEVLTDESATLDNNTADKKEKQRKYALIGCVCVLVLALMVAGVMAFNSFVKGTMDAVGNVVNDSGTIIDKIFDKLDDVTNDISDNANQQQDEALNEFGDFVDGIFDKVNEQQEEMNDKINSQKKEQEEKQAKTDFNSTIEMYANMETGFHLKSMIAEVITSNKKNSEHQITVEYGDIKASEESEMKNVRNSLDDITRYMVILNYDEDGYINKVEIEK